MWPWSHSNADADAGVVTLRHEKKTTSLRQEFLSLPKVQPLYDMGEPTFWGGISDEPPANVRSMVNGTIAREAVSELAEYLKGLDETLIAHQKGIESEIDNVTSQIQNALCVSTACRSQADSITTHLESDPNLAGRVQSLSKRIHELRDNVVQLKETTRMEFVSPSSNEPFPSPRLPISTSATSQSPTLFP